MSNIFNEVQFSKVPSNSFDLSHDVKMSCNMGDLVPVSLIECVPGDKINIKTETMARLAPMIAPVMHKVDIYIHHFFIPNRLIWSSWEEFITGGEFGSTPPAAPYMGGVGAMAPGTLGDYLGLPTGINIDKFSALPFAGYEMVYNEFYRDQNLIQPTNTMCTDGDISLRWGVDFGFLRKRAWQHDYFTSALPFAQKGAPVTLPVGSFTDVPVNLVGTGTPLYKTQGGSFIPPGVSGADFDGGAGFFTASELKTQAGDPVQFDPNGTLFADTSALNLVATSINDLRTAVRLQEWLERNARGGSRYIESILSHFGIHSPDARLQRPEYVGGSKQPIVISEVLQTSETDNSPQGNMAGHGISVGSGKNSGYFCFEHGYMISIMSILPKTAYQQGIPRHFSKFDKLQYYWPTFANLGEQEVLNRELYYEGVSADDDTFGYVPRYAEYKYLEARVAGDFRTSLSYWHMGRIFSSRPNLNKAFIEADPTHRIFAVDDPAVHKVYVHIFHAINARRLMPKYNIPTL